MPLWRLGTVDFDDLYAGSWHTVLRAVVLLVPAGDEARDVVQEAFARAYARWPEVSRLDNPEGWVRRVAVNAALDLGRRETRRRRAYLRWRGRPADVDEPTGFAVDIVRALDTLPADQRRAVVLHHVCDMSVSEIAAETGRPEGTVKTHLSRGRAALAAQLRHREDLTSRA